jgi:hypothetical protein
MKEADKKSITGGEKRVAPRYAVNLDASVLITAFRGDAENKESYLFLHGQLLDVSRSGLALYISEDDMQELNALGTGLMMRLLLPLPAKAVELEVELVRYRQIDEGEQGKVLVGTRITNMNTRDRILFMNFINDYETPQN